jgi:hypothetical protein
MQGGLLREERLSSWESKRNMGNDMDICYIGFQQPEDVRQMVDIVHIQHLRHHASDIR